MICLIVSKIEGANRLSGVKYNESFAVTLKTLVDEFLLCNQNRIFFEINWVDGVWRLGNSHSCSFSFSNILKWYGFAILKYSVGK